MFLFFYIANAILLILHEIESGYEREWEILRLPGGLTGFLLLHIPLAFALFYGLYFALVYPYSRIVIALIAGIAGFIPFLVHKVFVARKEYFNKPISNMLIYGNMVTGLVLLILAITMFLQ